MSTAKDAASDGYAAKLAPVVDAVVAEAKAREALARAELLELQAEAFKAARSKVDAFAARAPSKGDAEARVEAARSAVAVHFHAALDKAGLAEPPIGGMPCPLADRLATGCVACWVAAAAVLAGLAVVALLGYALLAAKALLVKALSRASRLPLVLLKLALASVKLALKLAFKLALLPVRLLLLPITLPLSLLGKKKPAAADKSAPPRRNTPTRASPRRGAR